MNILLLFLTDKEKHEKECPELEWEQPDIEVYKKERRPPTPARMWRLNNRVVLCYY